jgi:hypothetical protein
MLLRLQAVGQVHGNTVHNLFCRSYAQYPTASLDGGSQIDSESGPRDVFSLEYEVRDAANTFLSSIFSREKCVSAAPYYKTASH